jgi:tetratricopeptide (TPR) repeat protein
MGRLAHALLIALCLSGQPGSAARANDTSADPPAAERPRDAFGYPLDFLDRLELRERLRRGDYAGLEAALGALQAAFERDFHEEVRVEHAFWAFRDLDAAGAGAVVAWAEQAPDSWVAHLALAHHRISEGWRARGAAYASQTSAKQLQALRAFFESADHQIELALLRNPRLAHAWELRLEIARVRADAALRERALAEALAIHPLLYLPRSRYMIERRWGGSYAEQERLAAQAQIHAAANPKLALLLGAAEFDRGRDEAGCAEALVHYDAALRHGERANVLGRRGRCQLAMGNAARAIADFDRSLTLYPQDAWTLVERSRAFATLGVWERALADVKLARKLDPHDEELPQRLAAYRAKREFQAFADDPSAPEALGWGAAILLRSLTAGLGIVGLIAVWLVLRARAAARRDHAAAEALALDPARAFGRRVWSWYAWVIVLIHMVQYGFGWSSMDETDRIDAAITAFGLTGLLGYAHGVRLVSARLWRIAAVAFPGWNLIFWFVLGDAGLEQWPIWGFSMALLLPSYAALFLYGWRSQALWGDPERVPLVVGTPGSAHGAGTS